MIQKYLKVRMLGTWANPEGCRIEGYEYEEKESDIVKLYAAKAAVAVDPEAHQTLLDYWEAYDNEDTDDMELLTKYQNIKWIEKEVPDDEWFDDEETESEIQVETESEIQVETASIEPEVETAIQEPVKKKRKYTRRKVKKDAD